MARNRIIYQSEALYISPASTGYHLQSGQGHATETSPGEWTYGQNLSNYTAYDTGSLKWSGIMDPCTGNLVTGNDVATGPYGPSGAIFRTLVEPMHRVQSVNFNFTINRQDVNEFGKLARVDSIVMESPTVNLDFNYYLTDGSNERKMGFNIPTVGYTYEGGVRNPDSNGYWSGDLCVSGKSALSGIIEDSQGNNYFILVGREGKDLADDPISSSSIDYEVISIGNGFISDYTVEASVGAIPSASVAVEGFNIKIDDVASGSVLTNATKLITTGIGFPKIPAVKQTDGSTDISLDDTAYFEVNGDEVSIDRQVRFSVPMYETGISQHSALRPGDITFSMSNSGDYQGFTNFNGDGEAHLQSMSISIPMSRTILQRLGNTFGYARVIDLPLNIDVSLSAVVSELVKNNLFDALASVQKHDFTLTLHGINKSTGGSGDKAIVYQVKGARLESETFSSAIGDNETVDISFSCQVGGANDTDNGIFMDGSYSRWNTLNYFPLGKNKDLDSAYKGTPPAPGYTP